MPTVPCRRGTRRIPLHRRVRRPQLEAETPLVPIAAARQVVEEVSVWLGVTLPARYAAGLAHRARRIYAHSAPFRGRLRRAGDGGRDQLYVFLRHWLADRLRAERFDLYRQLPGGFATGAPLPARPARDDDAVSSTWLSPSARLLL